MSVPRPVVAVAVGVVLFASSCGEDSPTVDGPPSSAVLDATLTTYPVATAAVTTTSDLASPSTDLTAAQPLSVLTRYHLGFDRLGPIVIGMTPEQAAGAVGVPFEESRLSNDAACATLTPADGAGVWLYSLDGRIVMVSVTDPVRTVDGHGVGTSEAELLDAHGPNASASATRLGGRVVEISPDDPVLDAYRMVFDFANNGEAATQLRAGRAPEVVAMDEGCA